MATKFECDRCHKQQSAVYPKGYKILTCKMGDNMDYSSTTYEVCEDCMCAINAVIKTPPAEKVK